MPYIVTENCQECRFTDCVEVCPVECFYADDRMLYIHPEDCIDCGACEPACPVQAIYAEEDVPDRFQQWIGINAERCESGELELIVESMDALPTAEARKTELGF
jgi:ferredoxin